MEYRVVYDIASSGYKSWSFPAFGLIFIFIGLLLVALRKRLPFWWSRHPKASSVFTFSFLGFAGFWTIFAFGLTFLDYSRLSKAVEMKKTSVAVGIVTNFVPMPEAGHAMERFCVSDKCFEYSDYVVTAGFNNTSSHGGPIRTGRPVRVSYVGNVITKLEVGK
jgi:hypothetical protein